MTLRSRSAILTVAVIVLTAFFATPSAAQPASAPTADSPSERQGGTNPWHRKVFKYRKNWVFRSTRIDRCAFIEMTGKLVTHWRYTYDLPNGSPDPNTKTWKVNVVNPAIHVTGWPILGNGCDSTRHVRIKAQMKQGWHQSACQLKVSLGLGYPWSVEATPSFECRTNYLGHTESTEGPSRKTLHQFNTGTAVRFAEEIAPSSIGAYFEGQVLVRVHTRHSSDRFRAGITVRTK